MRSSKLYRATGGALVRAGSGELALRLQQCSISSAALRQSSEMSAAGPSGTSTITSRQYGERSYGAREDRSAGYSDRSEPRGKPSYARGTQDRDQSRRFDNNSGLDPYGNSGSAGGGQRSRSKFDIETGGESGQRESKKYKKGMFKEAFVSDRRVRRPRAETSSMILLTGCPLKTF